MSKKTREMVPNYLSYRIFHNIDAFGIDMANPLEAHIDYETDDRIIAMLDNGIGNENTSPIVNEHCRILVTN